MEGRGLVFGPQGGTSPPFPPPSPPAHVWVALNRRAIYRTHGASPQRSHICCEYTTTIKRVYFIGVKYRYMYYSKVKHMCL